MTKENLLKTILWAQGLYYGLTGLWAIISLDSFSKITQHYGDPFEMHSIAALAVVLGMAFIWGALQRNHLVFVGWLVFGSALAVIIPEAVYFSEIKNTLFLWGLCEEITVAMVALAALVGLKFRT